MSILFHSSPPHPPNISARLIMSDNAPPPKRSKTTILPGRFKGKFDTPYNFLSNLWPDVNTTRGGEAARQFGLIKPTYSIEIGGRMFNSVEHYYQYQQYMLIDPVYAETVIMAEQNALGVKQKSGQGAYLSWLFNTPNYEKAKGDRQMKVTKAAAQLHTRRCGWRIVIAMRW